MSAMTVVLSGEVAERLRRLLAEERYAAAEDAIADALDALDSQSDPALDAWLRDTVVGRAQAFAADPSRAMTPEELRSRLLPRD